MGGNAILTEKFVAEIEGDFLVPSYQRGYRWGKEEVTRLLDDSKSIDGERKYYLQPIVLKKRGDIYEVIDGQQRLTTIYIIYKFIYQKFDNPKYSISYETREKSKDFLKNITDNNIEKSKENIDFWFMREAYISIRVRFNSQEPSMQYGITKLFEHNVKVIWYEVGENEDGIKLFTRLNIGKIPLTNAELIKARFLSKIASNEINPEEVSFQWDYIEKELHNESFWFFLTNAETNSYQTRIDLILDLVSNKKSENRDKYFTFFEIEKKVKDKNVKDVWNIILKSFLQLKDWFQKHDYYHKIGYLIASNSLTLQDIFEASKDKTKKVFLERLNTKIKESINIKEENYYELSYDAGENDRKMLEKLLLLFNVESVCQHGKESQWFPFDKFKVNGNEKNRWSLEHIHAQQSEGLRTNEQWKEWLKYHKESIKNILSDSADLYKKMDALHKKESITRGEFESVQAKVVKTLSYNGNVNHLHNISNLALLNFKDNAALNNSTFDVKRNKIIELVKEGKYIPFCTRMVFLKYYSKSENNQLHFRTDEDGENYIESINYVLKDYLAGNLIKTEKEDK